MRLVIVVLLAIVAIGAAGVWALGEFGGAFSGGASEARAPTVREPELVAANDTKVSPPAANPAPSLRSTAPAAPPPPPPASEPTVQPQSAPPPASEAAPAPGGAAGKPSSPLITSLDDSSAKTSAAPPASAAPAASSTPAPPPPPASADQIVKPQSVPAAAPSPAAAAAAAAGVTPSIAEQFKTRKLTYNRPPEKLALNKPIDISLIIDSTGQNQAAEALKDLPGKIVERDVDLSDFVSAELKGADFDIQLQTAAVRQKLSPKIANEWRWRVTPTAVGTRTLTLTVYGYATGSLDAEPLDSYRDNITVEVQQLDQVITWAKGVQPLFAVLAAIAGATSALFAFLRFREEKKKGKAA